MSTHKPRGYNVNDFLSWYQKDELILQPKFQRRDVWSQKAKSALLDTILRGLPVPLIFIRQQIDPGKRKTVREVVDGQQRLNAVLNFCSPKDPKDQIKLDRGVHPKLGGKGFEDLPKEVQEEFLAYEFSVVLLEGASDTDVLDIFARLNTYAQKLTRQELLNAAWYGQFKQTVYGLGYDHLNFWLEMGILTDRQIVRMKEAELVSDLIVSMLDGPQAKRENVEKFYQDFDEEFSQKSIIKKQFSQTIDLIYQIMGKKLKHTIFSRYIMFYSLFLVFFDLVYGMPKSPIGHRPKKITASDHREILEALLSLNKDFKNESKVSEFINASLRSTADRRQRIIRHKEIYNRIKSAIH